MGSGASASLKEGMEKASEAEIKDVLAGLGKEELDKIKTALGAAGGGRKYIIGANWKSNPAKMADVTSLCEAWKGAKWDDSKCQAVLFAPTVYCAAAKAALAGTSFMMGIQNISKTKCGAFTGEITAGQAKDMGFDYCMIGHSERRTLYGETDADTFTKLTEAQDAGLKIIFAIGETLAEREAGTTDAINKRMLEGALPLVKDWDTFVIAYEPVWAIGTGKVATPEQAQETQAAIRAYVSEKMGPEIAAKVRIQYGGSASPDNCGKLGSNPDIDGFLVGGASLKPTFTDMMITCAGL